MNTLIALGNIATERRQQNKKWGLQSHPNGTGAFKPEAERFRALCERMAAEGRLLWWHILLEEVYEALAEENVTPLRKELIQVAAVATAWVEDIDRKTNTKEVSQ